MKDAPIIRTGAEAIKIIGQNLHPEFNLDDPQRRAMYEKAYYILTSNSAGCARLNLKPNKGLLLNGSLGMGKTTLMRVMQQLLLYTPRQFKWVTGKELIKMQDLATNAEILEVYGKALKCDLYIDDIGIGQVDKNRFGNWSNIISEILFERYDLFILEGFKTHLSCNLPTSFTEKERELNPGVATIEDMYGDRVLDRIREITNLLSWQGTSLRRKA